MVSVGPEARAHEVHDRARSELLQDVFGLLNRAGLEFCVLDGYDSYPDVIHTDVDILVQSPARVAKLLTDSEIVTIVQAVQYEAGSFCYVLCRINNGKPTFLSLDVSFDYRDQGRIFFRGPEFLGKVKPYGCFFVPTPALEFACYFVKKITKGDLNASHGARLTRLYHMDPEGCAVQLRGLLPDDDAGFVAAASSSGQWDQVRAHLARLRRSLLSYARRRRPVELLEYWTGELLRWGRRLIWPAGLVIAFIGPDGVGKSTVARLVEHRLAPMFRSTRRYHLRPHLGRMGDGGTPVIEPHAQPPRGLIASIAKIGLWWTDYFISYLIDILPRKVRVGLVIFDRHFLDLAVDPVRYRYGGPLWLGRIMGRLAPPICSIVFFLDAPAALIRSRKTEVPLDEIERQRLAYLRLAQSLPNGHVIDASRPLDLVVASILEKVLAAMRTRIARRLGAGG